MATKRLSRGFKDISFSFVPHPVTKDLSVLSNERAIVRSVRNLVETIPTERFFSPLIGTDIRASLFENFTPTLTMVIEDQINEKRCGHLDNKEIIPLTTMVNKIKTALNARKDKNFLIIARTDANSVEGIKKTIDRAKAYEDAGADIIFPEAMKDEKEFELIRKNSKVNLLANMTEFGKSKLLNYKKLENLGYNIVIYPVSSQRLAMKNVEYGLRAIFKDGHQNNIIDKMQTRKRLYDLVEYEKYNALNEKIYNFSSDGHE